MGAQRAVAGPKVGQEQRVRALLAAQVGLGGFQVFPLALGVPAAGEARTELLAVLLTKGLGDRAEQEVTILWGIRL